MARIGRARSVDRTLWFLQNKLKSLNFNDNFVPAAVEQLKRDVVYQGYTVASGVGGDYYISPSPSIIDFDDNPIFSIISNHTNTGEATLTVEGHETYPIEFPDGLVLVGGELAVDTIFVVGWDVDRFKLLQYFPIATSWSPTLGVDAGTWTETTGVSNYISHGNRVQIYSMVLGKTSAIHKNHTLSIPSNMTLQDSRYGEGGIFLGNALPFAGTCTVSGSNFVIFRYDKGDIPAGTTDPPRSGIYINSIFLRTA